MNLPFAINASLNLSNIEEQVMRAHDCHSVSKLCTFKKVLVVAMTTL